MSALTILRRYAELTNPKTLPLSILFEHTTKSITIFDAYPKSHFHFLILPRANAYPPLTIFDLANLGSLLKCDKDLAKQVLRDLAEDTKRVKKSIEEEMLKRFGFKWDIWVGFHAVPSMEYVWFSVLFHNRIIDSHAFSIDIYTFTLFRQTSALQPWKLRNTTIHFTLSLGFFNIWMKFYLGSMLSLAISKRWVCLTSIHSHIIMVP